jgi:hypothetical protein
MLEDRTLHGMLDWNEEGDGFAIDSNRLQQTGSFGRCEWNGIHCMEWSRKYMLLFVCHVVDFCS